MATNMADMAIEDPGPERTRGLAVAVAIGAVSLGLLAMPVSSPLPFLGWYGLSSILPATVMVVYRPGRRSVAIALALVVATLVLGTWLRTDADLHPFHRHHDGGVVATEAAAEMAWDRTNPYAADFTAALQPDHHTFDALDDPGVTNPLVDHYPYLPAAFLTHVPLVVLGDVAGDWSDPRMLYAAATLAALLVVGRVGPCEPWRRAAALVAIGGNLAMAVYLPWGGNDTAAASLVVVAALMGQRRPSLAGVLLAVAISMKALLVVALLPLAVAWMAWRAGPGRRALSVATLVLLATCLPYFLASPRDFVEDTISFNLGATDLQYPTSGIGLGAIHADRLGSVAVLGLSALLVLIASVAAVRWSRRSRRPEVALFAAGTIVFAGLLPARSFQISYVPLFVLLWGPIWCLSAEAAWGRRPTRATAAAAPGPEDQPASISSP